MSDGTPFELLSEYGLCCSECEEKDERCVKNENHFCIFMKKQYAS